MVDPDVLRPWPRGAELDFGYDVFPAVADRTRSIATYRLTRPLYDIGTPTTLESGRRYFSGLSR